MNTNIAFALRLHWLEARFELLKLLRLPGYWVPTVVFPAVFYLLFGLGLPSRGPIQLTRYLIGSYGAFGVIGAALFGFGAGVAVERGQGWLTVKRASPMPLSAYFAAKLFACLVFGALVVALLAILGVTVGGVRLPAETWLRLFAVLVLGGLPFCALGLTIGYLAGPNSAPALVNLIHLPLSFAAGLWIPIEVLPRALQAVAVWLPPYHLGQLALGVLGYGQGAWAVHVAALGAFLAVFMGLAVLAYRRDEGKSWG